MSAHATGFARRLSRIIRPSTGKSLIVPIDDCLTKGAPSYEIENLEEKIQGIVSGFPDAVLASPGHFKIFGDLLRGVGWICHLTVSPEQGQNIQVATVRHAMNLGCDAVAVRLNLRTINEEIKTLGQVIYEAEQYGLPVMAIVYPGQEESNNETTIDKKGKEGYAESIAQGVRLVADMGASIIKTYYSGNQDTFKKIVTAANGQPVVLSGGPAMERRLCLEQTRDAMFSGASGVAYGRNVFSRPDSGIMVRELAEIVHSDDIASPLKTVNI